MRLYNFHEELFSRYTERLSGPSHILGRVKHLWLYLIGSFAGNKKMLKKILKSNSPAGYREVVEQLFAVDQEPSCRELQPVQRSPQS
jgi:hypothetical protein